jgi:hypothetical protein
MRLEALNSYFNNIKYNKNMTTTIHVLNQATYVPYKLFRSGFLLSLQVDDVIDKVEILQEGKVIYSEHNFYDLNLKLADIGYGFKGIPLFFTAILEVKIYPTDKKYEVICECLDTTRENLEVFYEILKEFEISKTGRDEIVLFNDFTMNPVNGRLYKSTEEDYKLYNEQHGLKQNGLKKYVSKILSNSQFAQQ